MCLVFVLCCPSLCFWSSCSVCLCCSSWFCCPVVPFCLSGCFVFSVLFVPLWFLWSLCSLVVFFSSSSVLAFLFCLSLCVLFKLLQVVLSILSCPALLAVISICLSGLSALFSLVFLLFCSLSCLFLLSVLVSFCSVCPLIFSVVFLFCLLLSVLSELSALAVLSALPRFSICLYSFLVLSGLCDLSVPSCSFRFLWSGCSLGSLGPCHIAVSVLLVCLLSVPTHGFQFWLSLSCSLLSLSSVCRFLCFWSSSVLFVFCFLSAFAVLSFLLSFRWLCSFCPFCSSGCCVLTVFLFFVSLSCVCSLHVPLCSSWASLLLALSAFSCPAALAVVSTCGLSPCYVCSVLFVFLGILPCLFASIALGLGFLSVPVCLCLCPLGPCCLVPPLCLWSCLPGAWPPIPVTYLCCQHAVL